MDKYTYRAKDIDTGEWVYGYYLPATHYLDESSIHIIFLENATAFPRNEFCECYEVDSNTICRCTGLIDKNGTLVYEHDYVRTIFGRICEVVWFSSPRHCGWDLVPVANLNCSAPPKDCLWDPEWLIVLGNKFDNTELMEISNE